MNPKVSICFVLVLATVAYTVADVSNDNRKITSRDVSQRNKSPVTSANKVAGKGNQQGRRLPVSGDKVLGNINQNQAEDRVARKANQAPVSRVPANRAGNNSNQESSTRRRDDRVAGKAGQVRKPLVSADGVIGQVRQDPKSSVRADGTRRGKIIQVPSSRVPPSKVAGRANQVDSRRG